MCKVSVLMPVYNAEKYLAEAINSIISQTYRDWELVIINDGSTDSSLSIINSFSDSRIKVINNETNLGLIKTLNKGIGLCNGEYIARMDADDISMPNRLALQVDFLDSNEEYILCGTNADVIDSHGKITGKIINPTKNILLQISLLFTNPFIHPSMMICRDILTVNFFDENAIYVEDYELWTRLADLGQIANLELPLLQYRWHETNVSVKHSEIQEATKNKIISSQLAKLDISPTEQELYWHRATFKIYSLGKETSIRDQNIFEEVNNWFSKLKTQNLKLSLYPHADFEAFLWSRWIVLSISQKKVVKACFPQFITFYPRTIIKVLQLLIYLRKK